MTQAQRHHPCRLSKNRSACFVEIAARVELSIEAAATPRSSKQIEQPLHVQVTALIPSGLQYIHFY